MRLFCYTCNTPQVRTAITVHKPSMHMHGPVSRLQQLQLRRLEKNQAVLYVCSGQQLLVLSPKVSELAVVVQSQRFQEKRSQHQVFLEFVVRFYYFPQRLLIESALFPAAGSEHMVE
jgi:hypothetical protein